MTSLECVRSERITCLADMYMDLDINLVDF